MSHVGGAGGSNELQKLMMKIEGEKDRQSSASSTARDAMEAMNPMNILGGLAEVFKALGSISG